MKLTTILSALIVLVAACTSQPTVTTQSSESPATTVAEEDFDDFITRNVDAWYHDDPPALVVVVAEEEYEGLEPIELPELIGLSVEYLDESAARTGDEPPTSGLAAIALWAEYENTDIDQWVELLGQQTTLVATLRLAQVFTAHELAPGWTTVATFELPDGRPWFAGTNNTALTLTLQTGRLISLDGTVSEVGSAPIPYIDDLRVEPAGSRYVALSDTGDSAMLVGDEWITLPKRIQAGWILGTAFVDTSLFVVTAPSRNEGTPGTVMALDVYQEQWTDYGSVPEAINVGDVTASPGALIVSGTRQGSNNNILGDQQPAVLRLDIASGTWETLPDAPISGQAGSVFAAGSDLVAWNYEMQSSVRGPDGSWSAIIPAPLDPMECYPRSISGADYGIAAFCGQVAVVDKGHWAIIPTNFGTIAPAQTTIWQLTEPERGVFRVDAYPIAGDGSVACPIQRDNADSLTFFATCTDNFLELRPVYRRGMELPTLEQAVTALISGTTPDEQKNGLVTGFDYIGEGAPLLVDISISADGTATMSFTREGEPWSPGPLAGTSAQLFSFIEPLQATVFSASEVDAFEVADACWGEMGCDVMFTRIEWESVLLTNHGILSHEGCGIAESFHQARCTVDDQIPIAQAIVDVPADDTLNLRLAPSAGAPAAEELAPQVEVDVFAASAVAADGGLWVLVQSETETVGWVNNAFLAYDLPANEATLHSIVDFARYPSDEAFAAIPFADNVTLGLWDDHTKVVAASQLRDLETWVMDVDFWAAYVGPFDILHSAGRHQSLVYQVGLHDHCAGSPLAAPTGFESHTQVSAQPAELTFQTCLQWSSIDTFINEDGRIEGVFLDIWEP